MSEQDSAALPDAARTEPETPAQVLTLVCEQCGKDYFFDREPPPAQLRCDKCGSTVFRAFESGGGEAAQDFRDSTERDLDPDDAEGDVLPGDILDLNNV